MNSKSSGTERFARLHNNLVRKDDGLGAKVREGMTPRQLDLMLELIAAAQREQDARLEFPPNRAASQLGFGRRDRDPKRTLPVCSRRHPTPPSVG